MLISQQRSGNAVGRIEISTKNWSRWARLSTHYYDIDCIVYDIDCIVLQRRREDCFLFFAKKISFSSSDRSKMMMVEVRVIPLGFSPLGVIPLGNRTYARCARIVPELPA